jgi:hypothetical protein
MTKLIRIRAEDVTPSRDVRPDEAPPAGRSQAAVEGKRACPRHSSLHGPAGPARTTGMARFGTGQARIDVRAVAPDAAAAYQAALAADLRAPAGR